MKSTVRGVGAKVSVGRFLAIAVAAGAVAVSVLPAASASAATRRVQVSAQTIGNNGKVLVSNGRALYFLVAIWPALTVPAHVKASAGSGVQKSKLGVTTDMAGARQVTYNGQPVYWYKLDKKGQVSGNITDQWGKWTVVVVKKPAGGGSSSSGTTTTSNAGSGGVSF